ncbi:MAG: RidA family protein [Gammaproteobacteria bacterium]|nr:RidA family protein [Gammaproteobacteria bacterium]
MNQMLNPDAVAPPFGNYCHAVEIPTNNRRLYVSGQVGVMPDGTIAQGIEAQTDQVFRNIISIVEAAGMTVSDIVKFNSYLTRQKDIAVYREVRNRIIGDHRAASTLVVVSALASPDWLIEIEAVAAKAVHQDVT